MSSKDSKMIISRRYFKQSSANMDCIVHAVQVVLLLDNNFCIKIISRKMGMTFGCIKFYKGSNKNFIFFRLICFFNVDSNNIISLVFISMNFLSHTIYTTGDCKHLFCFGVYFLKFIGSDSFSIVE